MVYATFKIRVFDKNNDTSLWLIGKKRGIEVTRDDVANAIQAKTDSLDIWASDIEDLKQIETEEEKQEALEKVASDHKLFP